MGRETTRYTQPGRLPNTPLPMTLTFPENISTLYIGPLWNRPPMEKDKTRKKTEIVAGTPDMLSRGRIALSGAAMPCDQRLGQSEVGAVPEQPSRPPLQVDASRAEATQAGGRRLRARAGGDPARSAVGVSLNL
jgi:hypothetical protein